MEDPSLWIYAALIAVAFVAGAIDAIAGGGGLLVLPALLLAGIPPLEALATNKIQGLFGTGSATLTFARKGLLDLKTEFPYAIACFIGSVIGAILATRLPTEFLRMMMPIVLIAIAIYFLFQKNLSDEDRKSYVSPFLMGFMVLPMVGFYDGIFGPGAGSFYMLALVSLGGFGILKATARTKFMNFASNVGGAVSFAIAGAVIWPIGLAMAFGQVLGANIGAKLAINNGAKLIRPLLVVMCIALAIKLLVQ
ncbi:TSUP family transporter [Amylibacter sp. SFDW26]|uniref:TSUP family transporter n=1 Tax=Amylibacter sp. SFDW26 TaxID=2652722 RepID=UPI001261DBB8|nr:TSUP family transporter [Amylibacter sp. SFDW26]KAB7614353.1 TSUP family transporter [Amylibacter sp. SFDW26]